MRAPRAAAVLVTVLPLAAVLLLVGCTESAPSAGPPQLGPADTVRAAQQLLTDRCLTSQGLTPPRPGKRATSETEARETSAALFGTGPTELSLALPNGYVVRQHSDGCLAAAQRRLYGDQKRWFLASTSVNNLKADAPRRERAAHRALNERALEQARALLAAETERGTGP